MFVITEDHFGEPTPREYAVQARGGPTQLNLVLESLQIAALGLGEAAAIAQEQASLLNSITTELFGSVAGLAPHWRAPLLGAQLGISLAETTAGSWAMQETARAVRAAHQRYRDTEALLEQSLRAGQHLAQYPQIHPHILDPQGDKALADAWARTALVNLGHGIPLLLKLLARRQPVLRTSGEGFGLVAQSLLEKARRISRQSTQTLNPQDRALETAEVHQLADHLQAHAAVAEHGDFSISTQRRPGEGARHIIHIPGLELPAGLEDLDLAALADGELDLSAGRGLNSLLDAGTNDSAHLQGVIETALEDSGAAAGDELVVTGYSLGGLHALNIAAGGRLARKYRLSHVVTVGAPARQGPALPGVRTTSFQDVNDPVPGLLGEQSELSAERVQITYEHQDPEAEPGGIFGASHGYGHNVDAIRRLEDEAAVHLDEGQQAQLEELAETLSGEHRARVYSTAWDSAAVETLEEAIAELAGRLEEHLGPTSAGGSGVGVRSPGVELGLEWAQDEAIEQR